MDSCKEVKINCEELSNIFVIGICNSIESANEYKLKNGGVIFKEQGKEVYKVFPKLIDNSKISYMEEE